jgi:preprotein translocase subunit SecA
VLTLFHAELAPEEAAGLEQAHAAPVDGNGRMSYEHQSLAGADAIAAATMAEAVAAAPGAAAAAIPAGPQQVVAAPHEKIGRNDPCWCGSGKKFKKCHGA